MTHNILTLWQYLHKYVHIIFLHSLIFNETEEVSAI